MSKKVIYIVAAILIIGALGLGSWWFLSGSGSQTPQFPVSEPVGYKFPAAVEEIDWEDRAVFRAGLTESAAGILGELPRASSYFISLEIPDDLTSGVSGHQVVRYFNNEDVPLTEIYFRLFPNYQGGTMEVSHLTVNGGPMIPSLESDNTALRVDLIEALQPGDSLVMEMDFELGIPTEMGGNYGLYGYFEDVLVLDTFYPLIPVYDESGWYREYPQDNGDHTYNDASFYIVQVTAPVDLVLASSGVIVDRQLDETSQTTVIASGPSRDFYLAGSKVFSEINQQVGEVLVRVLTRPEYRVNQEYALDYAVNSIEIYSNRVGPYPYSEFEVMSSPMMALGIEYPGITSIVVNEFVDGVDLYGLPSEQMLESTIAHEAGHMWFYNAVGNDQQDQPWVDEALVQYLTYLYYLDRYGDGSGYVDSWKSRWNQVANADIPIGLPAGEYHGAEYSGIVYGRGPLFFYDLENELGLDTVTAAIQDYYQENLWGIGYADELQEAFENVCDCSLQAEFEEWVYEE